MSWWTIGFYEVAVGFYEVVAGLYKMAVGILSKIRYRTRKTVTTTCILTTHTMYQHYEWFNSIALIVF